MRLNQGSIRSAFSSYVEKFKDIDAFVGCSWEIWRAFLRSQTRVMDGKTDKLGRAMLIITVLVNSMPK